MFRDLYASVGRRSRAIKSTGRRELKETGRGVLVTSVSSERVSSAFRGERKERGGSDQTGGMSKPAGEKLVFNERRRERERREL